MDLNMKPSLAVDEMFSEVAGYMDMEEVRLTRKLKECLTAISFNNFLIAFLQSGSATGMMMDHLPTPTNDKHVHADFYNDFDDLFDDDDNWAKVRGANDNGAK